MDVYYFVVSYLRDVISEFWLVSFFYLGPGMVGSLSSAFVSTNDNRQLIGQTLALKFSCDIILLILIKKQIYKHVCSVAHCNLIIVRSFDIKELHLCKSNFYTNKYLVTLTQVIFFLNKNNIFLPLFTIYSNYSLHFLRFVLHSYLLVS